MVEEGCCAREAGGRGEDALLSASLKSQGQSLFPGGPAEAGAVNKVCELGVTVVVRQTIPLENKCR